MVNDEDFQGSAQGVEGIRSLTEMYKQKQQTRRLITICSAATLVGACALVIFAPNGKDKVAYSIGGTLAILSIGVIGLTNFSLKYGKLQLRGGRVEPQNADKLWESALGDRADTPHISTRKSLTRRQRKREKERERRRFERPHPPAA